METLKRFGTRFARRMVPGLVVLAVVAGGFGFTAATTGTSAYSYNGGEPAIRAAYYRDAFYQLRYNQPATVVLFDRYDEDGAVAEATIQEVARYLHMTVRTVHHDESVVAYPSSRAYGG